MKSKLILKLSTAVFAATLSLAAYASEPQAYSPKELAGELQKLPEPTEIGGAAVHSKMFCASCHGAHGISPTANWPHVAGQPREVTMKALLDYRAGKRNQSPTASLMTDVAKRMTDQQIVDVALLYENIQGPDGKALKVGKNNAQAQTSSAILKLIAKGDPKRAITPCAACHGTTGQGNLNGKVPVLHGQNPSYIVTALKEYRSGVRASDTLKEMRFFASHLTDQEIDELAAYYGNLKGWEVKPSE